LPAVGRLAGGRRPSTARERQYCLSAGTRLDWRKPIKTIEETSMNKRESILRRCKYLWLALALAALPAPASTVRIYVTDSAGDSVHVIDPATNKVVQVIKGIEVPHGVNFSPDGKRVYVTNESDSTLDVVDQKSGKVIKKVPLSGHPNNLAVSRDGARVIICIAEDKGGLDIVDTKAMQVVKTIPLGGRMHNVYVTPDGKYAVAGSVKHKFMSVVDLATDQVAWQVKFDTGVRPMAFEAGPDGSTSRIFVQLSELSGFAVVDFAARKEVARIQFPDTPGGFGAAEGRTGTPSHGIGIAPDGKTLWVNSVFANAVFAYSLPDLTLLGHASFPELKLPGRGPIGAVADWLAFEPEGKTIYVGNSGFKSVVAIDMKTMKVVATIPVGEVPKRMNTLVLH
jgi:YVTN family beta-propeller protein